MREKLSAFIITKNEEDKIARCLEHLQWVDEIVIVDSYSTDKTIEIAKKWTKKIYKRRFDGYGPQKQVAIEKCTNGWILEVDADEIVSEALKKELEELLNKPERLNQYAAYIIKRQEYFLKKPIMVSEIPRLYRKDKVKYEGIIHEKVKIEGILGKGNMKNKLSHEVDKYDSIAKRIEKNNDYTKREAEQLWKEKPNVLPIVIKMVVVPLAYFLWMYLRKGLIFKGYRGLIWSLITMHYHFLIYAKVYEYLYKEKHASRTKEE